MSKTVLKILRRKRLALLVQFSKYSIRHTLVMHFLLYYRKTEPREQTREPSESNYNIL